MERWDHEGPKMEGLSRDLAETPYSNTEFDEERRSERPSRPESRMSNGRGKEVHRLGAPSPENQSNSAFVTGFFQDFEEKLLKYLATSIQNMSNHDFLVFAETDGSKMLKRFERMVD